MTTPLTSNHGKFMDSTPNIVAAGKVLTVPDENARYCIAPEVHGAKRPETPGDIKKYRKSTRDEPGRIVQHPGRVGDSLPPEENPYGVRNQVAAWDSQAKDVIFGKPKSALMEYANDRKESVYRTKQREPLGQSFKRGHEFPETVNDPEFRFGVTIPSSDSAKNALYPIDSDDDEKKTKELYIKSHGDYDPGEQRKRHYDWGKTPVDPQSFRFGSVDSTKLPDGVGVKRSLAHDGEGNGGMKVDRITSKRVEDFKQRTVDELGKARILGSGPEEIPKEKVFGVKTSGNEWGAWECITGDYKRNEQEPDPDLGRSLKFGWRNVTSETRAFGIPSIRTDIPPPRIRSVADPQNYGNEANAQALLYPSKYAFAGVDEDDFLKPLPYEELRDLVAASGILDDDSLFDAVYQEACAAEPSGMVSLELFRRFLIQFQDQMDYQ